MKWIYKKTRDNKARFVLGRIPSKSSRLFVCIGVNPSTAEPNKLDRTLSRVQSLAMRGKYDGWIMLNLYPQRATRPSNLHSELQRGLHKKNIRHIKNTLMTKSQLTVWAAWGGLIRKRKFLRECLKDIVTNIPGKAEWISMGKLVANKHPHHPLYLSKHLKFDSFDIEAYLKTL